ncbi:MAG TPA: DUF1905 domain-containing protein [Cryomorphaceae bacterium]|jgi:hypothetical protein|nr:DUF1905 domain-containing protein [Cryomorphaceae bacterium]|tara:strand:+ start:737 stop:1222 length:486 start_codon:yes stop_codon:yes gene_type:complete
MKLLYTGTAFIEPMFPNMPHNVLSISTTIIADFPQKHRTRIVLKINGEGHIQCGLNSHIPGMRCMMISKKNMSDLGLLTGEKVAFEIFEDPDPLGVAVPEVLKALLEQDEVVERIWNKLTDGRKRTICHSTMRIKNIDLQVERALEFFEVEREKMVQKGKW